MSREASKKASLMTDTTTLDPTRESLKLPAFEQTAMLAVTKALELWRDEALNGEAGRGTSPAIFLRAWLALAPSAERDARGCQAVVSVGNPGQEAIREPAAAAAGAPDRILGRGVQTPDWPC